jgi:hypothetical protein
MQKPTKQVKERVKVDRNDEDQGVFVDLNYDYVIDIGNGRYRSPVSGKRYKEVNIDTTNDMGSNGRY